MAGANVNTATDQNFETEVLKSSIPVLIDFWAEWCGPCRAIAPLIDQVATEKAGKLKVYKMNVDENYVTPAKFGVRSIPTLLLIKDGQVVNTHVGSTSKPVLDDFITKAL